MKLVVNLMIITLDSIQFGEVTEQDCWKRSRAIVFLKEGGCSSELRYVVLGHLLCTGRWPEMSPERERAHSKQLRLDRRPFVSATAGWKTDTYLSLSVVAIWIWDGKLSLLPRCGDGNYCRDDRVGQYSQCLDLGMVRQDKKTLLISSMRN